MIRLEMKNCNMILTEKWQKHHFYHLEKLRNMTILLADEEILPPEERRVIEQVKFIYSPSGKAFEKQTKTTEDRGEKKKSN